MSGDGGAAVSRVELRANRGDRLHDLQMLRDLAIINARTVGELGPLPAGGLPAAPKRKPSLAASSSILPPSADAGHQENETMDFKSMAVAASIALAACAPMTDSSQKEQNNRAEESRKKDSPMQAHKFRLNPNPKQRYDITMSIKDAPGTFEYVRFGASYEAKDCSYVISEFEGVRGHPEHHVELDFRKMDEHTYVGTLYLDAMVDEDYYGNGVCHWQMTGMGVGLKATGAEKETRFSSSLMRESIQEQRSQETYFWKDRYPREEGYDNFPEFGEGALDKVPIDERDEFFAITLTSREVQP